VPLFNTLWSSGGDGMRKWVSVCRAPGCGGFARRLAGMLVALVLLASGAASAGEPIDLAGSAWARAARPHGIDPALLYALTLVESRRALGGHRVAPWPWVIHTPTGGYWFNSYASARRGLKAVLRKWPAKRVDVGAAQINVGWQRARFGDPAELLDLDRNLQVAAAILAGTIASTPDPVIGIGRYHHWASDARSRAYGQRVWWAYREVTFGESQNRYVLGPPAAAPGSHAAVLARSDDGGRD